MPLDVEVAADRPATESTIEEIEITPEMIEAGVLEFLSFDSRFDSEEDAVTLIYQAMYRQSPCRLLAKA
jgi:hypothetical protein